MDGGAVVGGALVLFGLVLGVAVLLSVGFLLAWKLAFVFGWSRMARAVGRAAPYIYGSQTGGAVRFNSEVSALREEGRIADAAALATKWVQDENVSITSRNVAIDILISAGAYQTALRAERKESDSTGAADVQGLALIQINLAEADYNLGRWDAAKARLDHVERECSAYPITWAGLLLQRAWIAAHQGRAAEALALCDSVQPRWFPRDFRSEYYFTRAAALLAAGALDDADAAVMEGARAARRISSKRNALFLHARVAAAREDWARVESLCRSAAEHRFRGQGGGGLLLWARALRETGRNEEAEQALRLVLERDPESESAATAATLLNESKVALGAARDRA